MFSWEQGRWVLWTVGGSSAWQLPHPPCASPPMPRRLPPGPCSPQRLLNWMLALACQRGHLGLVKLLVLTHGADPESYAVRKNEFPVIVRLPLYAAIKSGEPPTPSPGPVSPARENCHSVEGSALSLAHSHLRGDICNPVFGSSFQMSASSSLAPLPHPLSPLHVRISGTGSSSGPIVGNTAKGRSHTNSH